jgi:hypothetical protein
LNIADKKKFNHSLSNVIGIYLTRKIVFFALDSYIDAHLNKLKLFDTCLLLHHH